MYVVVWHKATLPLPARNDEYHQIYGNVKYTKNTKNLKITSFKDDRGFASESKVCNDGCNEQQSDHGNRRTLI